MSFWYLDFNNGRGLQDGTTYANAASSLAQFTTGPASGDIIKCAETPAYNTGITGTFSKQAITVTLSAGASALFKDIYMDGAWTGAANVTATADAVNKKQGSNAASMVIAGAFTTGQIAYFATGTLNLSSFNRISFWIKSSLATVANTFRLDLCSDTVGAVGVNSYTLPALTANVWTLLTTPDLGSLGSSIKSVNLQALLDPGATTIIIDNVLACTANGLNMSSVIGLGDGWWWGQKSLSGTTMVLDNGTASLQGAGRGHWNINGNHSGTFTLYAINPIPSYALITGVSNAGTELSGGWDQATMTTQSASGYTFLDRGDMSSIGFGGNSPKIHSRMGYTRCQPANGLFPIDCYFAETTQAGLRAPQTINGVTAPSGIRLRATGANSLNTNGLFTVGVSNCIFQDCVAISSDAVGFASTLGGPAVAGTTYINCLAANCGAGGFGTGTTTLYTVINCTAYDNTGIGFGAGSGNLVFNATATGNTTYGMSTLGEAKIYGLNTSGNTSGGITHAGHTYIKNWFATDSNKAVTNNTVNWLHSTDENGIVGNNAVYCGSLLGTAPATTFTFQATGAGTYSGSGLAWIGYAGALFSNAGLTATNPARVCVGTFYVESGKNATFSYRVSRNSTTKIFGALRIYGGLQGGIGSYGNDIVVPTNPASAWATNPPTASDYTQYSISTGTATESGVVEVWFEFYPITDATGRIMIDACTASQV